MKKIIIILVAVSLFGFAGLFAVTNAPTKSGEIKQPQVSVAPSIQVKQDTITYNGREDVDALTLLKENNTAEQNSAGLVTTINGRTADDSKREYWAFSVNGEMAPVGPAQYVTKATDKIEWKIEHY